MHPAATIAWGFLSIGFEVGVNSVPRARNNRLTVYMQVVKNQRDTQQAILDLYTEMISAYEEASKDDILQQRDDLHGTYSSLFKQTIECAIFIEGYTKKSGISMHFESRSSYDISQLSQGTFSRWTYQPKLKNSVRLSPS